MDRSVRRLPDPIAGLPQGERRLSVRQKLNTPVYASFNGPQTGMVVDLSELLELHEHGFAVQTSERLEMNRAATLCLDLPETKSYIHGSGQVIWSDDAGRGGIRFSSLYENSQKILKEWLFDNLLIACSNREARTGQLARHGETNPEASGETTTTTTTTLEPSPLPESSVVVSSTAGIGPLAAMETVRRRVRDLGNDVAAVLQFIADCALSLTESSGAALAFFTGDQMTCRVRTGEPAPPLGAPLDTRQGLSGECVRSGRLVWCEDTGNDPRVDPDLCRSLGIGSLMAAPVVSDFRVAGVLEVFSPHPRGFTKAQGMVLDQLVEMIPKTQFPNAPVESAQSGTPIQPDDVSVAAEASQRQFIQPGEAESTSKSATRTVLQENRTEVGEQVSRPVPVQSVVVQEQESAPATPPRLLYRALLGLSIAVAVTAAGYVIGPAARNWAASQDGQKSLVKSAEAASTPFKPGTADRSSEPKALPELQKLAEAGDADAQWLMGVRYHDGEGVAHDDAQAVQWFQLAAEQGNVAAQGALGAYYWRGRGVPADLSRAYFWSAIAMAQGDEMSKSRIEGLSSQMTPGQVSAARQLAEGWIRAHSLQAKSSTK